MRIVGFVLAEDGTKNGFSESVFHLIKLPLAAKKLDEAVAMFKNMKRV